MTKEKFREMVYDEMKNLEQDKKKAVAFSLESDELEEELNKIIYSKENFDEAYDSCIDEAPYKIKRYFDGHEYGLVWLYKYSCIGLLIKGLYGLPYDEHNTLKGLLLGMPLNELEKQYLNDDESEFVYYSNFEYKPIHPWHHPYDSVIFDYESHDDYIPYLSAKYWKDNRKPKYNIP